MATALTQAAEELADRAYRLLVADPEQARELAWEALRLAREEDDPAGESAAHRAIGMIAFELDDAGTAVRHLEHAVRAGRRAGPAREAEARMSLALALVSQGATRRALHQADRAASIAGGPKRGPLHLQHAIILERLGRLDEALEACRLAIASFRRSGDRNGEARALCDRGVLRTYRGELGAADSDLRRAEALCEQLGLTLMAASVRQNRGFVAAQRGDLPLALECYEQAQPTFEELGGTRYAVLELDRCQLLLAAGLIGEARDSAKRAIDALELTGMEVDVAEAKLQRAEVALAERDWKTAREAADAALAAFIRQRRPTWAALARYAAVRARRHEDGSSAATIEEARAAAAELERAGWSARAVHAHLLAARVALERGRPRAARRHLETARRARFRGPVAVRVAGWHAEALRQAGAGAPRPVLRAVAGGLRALDRDRAALGATELRSHVAAQAEELAALGLRSALDVGRPAAVLALVEQARAQTLHLTPIRPPEDAALAVKLGELRAVVALAAQEVQAGRPVAPLVRRQTRLEHEIRRRLLQVPGTRRLQAVRPPSLRALREALGDRVLVEYFSVDGEHHAVTVGARRARLVALGSVADVDRELTLLRPALCRMATRGSDVHRRSAKYAAAQLQQLLVEPLLGEIGERELVIVPTGKLHALPWATLPALAARPLSVAPSAALWLRARGQAAAPRAGPPLLVAGPDLRHAHAEVRAIDRLYDGAVTLTGRDAKVEAVTANLRGCDRAHLACHGVFRADNPLFSALRLADGPLTVHDVESLGAGPSELVLSACDSGLTDVRPGDELMGLTSALLAIGARVIIASTVEVPDAPTQRLMVRLHERLQAGAGAARALAEARSAVTGGDDAEAVARDAFLCFGAG